MQNLQMVDLASQYGQIKNEIDQSIQSVIDSCQFINGSEVSLFSKELADYLQVKHVIPCANGTDALQIAMMALDLKPGDEVLVPAFTFAATVEVIALLGLVPKFVDVDKDTFCIEMKGIEKYLSSKTKAIVPVHLFGQCSNMDEIVAFAEKNNLFIIEDNAQAIGADYTFKNGSVKKAGTIGQIGTTSFFPSKNLGCYGDGGALFTNDDLLAEKMRMIVNHGSKVRYFHDEVGVNSRLDSIQAAILRVKLRKLNHYNESRLTAAKLYNELLGNHPKIQTPHFNSSSTHVFHQYTLKLNGVNREKLMKELSEVGIPSMIYYPIPLHLQKAYNNGTYKKGDFIVSETLCEEVISFPMHTELEEKTIEFICQNIIKSINNQ